MAGGRRGHQTRAATSREVYLHSIVGAYCWSFKVVIPTRIFSLPCVVLNSIVPESSWLTPPSHLESATRPPAAATNTPSPLSSVLHDPLPLPATCYHAEIASGTDLAIQQTLPPPYPSPFCHRLTPSPPCAGITPAYSRSSEAQPHQLQSVGQRHLSVTSVIKRLKTSDISQAPPKCTHDLSALVTGRTSILKRPQSFGMSN